MLSLESEEGVSIFLSIHGTCCLQRNTKTIEYRHTAMRTESSC